MRKLQHALVRVVALSVLLPGLALAQTTETAAQGPFRLEFREVDNTRGPVIEGYLYNGLSARITDVRIRIDSLDAGGQVIGESRGWVVGDAPAGSQAFFVVPVSVPGATYSATVEAFDEIAPETPGTSTP